MKKVDGFKTKLVLGFTALTLAAGAVAYKSGVFNAKDVSNTLAPQTQKVLAVDADGNVASGDGYGEPDNDKPEVLKTKLVSYENGLEVETGDRITKYSDPNTSDGSYVKTVNDGYGGKSMFTVGFETENGDYNVELTVDVDPDEFGISGDEANYTKVTDTKSGESFAYPITTEAKEAVRQVAQDFDSEKPFDAEALAKAAEDAAASFDEGDIDNQLDLLKEKKKNQKNGDFTFPIHKVLNNYPTMG